MLEHLLCTLLCTVWGMKIKISRNLIETIQLELTNQSMTNWSFQITGRAARVNARFMSFIVNAYVYFSFQNPLC